MDERVELTDAALIDAVRQIRDISEELDPARRMEPMRFLRHREVVAWQKRERITGVAELVRQGKVYLPPLSFRETARLLNASEYRGGPLVV